MQAINDAGSTGSPFGPEAKHADHLLSGRAPFPGSNNNKNEASTQ